MSEPVTDETTLGPAVIPSVPSSVTPGITQTPIPGITPGITSETQTGGRVQPANQATTLPNTIQNGNVVNSVANFPQGTTRYTQASMVQNPIRPTEVIHRLTFSSDTIKRLTVEDFNIDGKDAITLKHNDCMLILFYVENTESYQLANIWALAAQQIAGPVFAAINMLSERKVATALTKLKGDGSNPLHWASIRQLPFIMVYRNGWPVAFYNGAREVQAIIDYALTLACQAGYYEIEQNGGSMQAEARIEMGPHDVYRNTETEPNKIRDNSLQYNSQSPIRGFNPNLQVVVPGSREAISATQSVQRASERQEALRQTGTPSSMTETIETAPTVSGPQITTPVSTPAPTENIVLPA